MSERINPIGQAEAALIEAVRQNRGEQKAKAVDILRQFRMAQEAGLIDPLPRKEFLPEALSALAYDGMLVLDTNSVTLESLIKKRRIKGPSAVKDTDLVGLRSRPQQVAINPGYPFIYKSDGKSFRQQRELFEKEKEWTEQRYPGATLVLGNVADVTSVLDQYMDFVGSPFVIKGVDYFEVVTTSKIMLPKVPADSIADRFRPDTGVGYAQVTAGVGFGGEMRLSTWAYPYKPSDGVFMMPLVVPAVPAQE